ncbi:hypothetical protein C8Q80DRAFT_1148383 [Daedaleopsis nitida]|nr:hypothetical protein C8Q80DRAFT_1148383 [Daedaleopsis nitida]
MATRVTYENIPLNRPAQEESFEERRIADYLHAYRTTGRPPAPCPQVPTDPQQRVALGLPPLFVPFSEIEGGAMNGVAVPPADFEYQAFKPTKQQEHGVDAMIQSISAQPEYFDYSPEELRAEAYRLGKKLPGSSTSGPSTSIIPAIQPRPVSFSSIVAALNPNQPPPDSLQSVNSIPPYDQHSFEELRMAFLRAGRPLTSPEIVAQNAVLRLTV